jgi:hypothetical protein
VNILRSHDIQELEDEDNIILCVPENNQ